MPSDQAMQGRGAPSAAQWLAAMEQVEQSKQTVNKLRQFLNLTRRCGVAARKPKGKKLDKQSFPKNFQGSVGKSVTSEGKVYTVFLKGGPKGGPKNFKQYFK